MKNGFTFIEIVMVLSIIALLALFALPQYQHFTRTHQQKNEVAQLLHALTLARQHAILNNQTVSICPYAENQPCSNNWSNGLVVFSDQVITSVLFQHHAHIFLKTFPAGSEYLLTFAPNGYTQAQNGSFYYCPSDDLPAQKIVFNQAGRAYVTSEGAAQECSATQPLL